MPCKLPNLHEVRCWPANPHKPAVIYSQIKCLVYCVKKINQVNVKPAPTAWNSNTVHIQAPILPSPIGLVVTLVFCNAFSHSPREQESSGRSTCLRFAHGDTYLLSSTFNSFLHFASAKCEHDQSCAWRDDKFACADPIINSIQANTHLLDE